MPSLGRYQHRGNTRFQDGSGGDGYDRQIRNGLMLKATSCRSPWRWTEIVAAAAGTSVRRRGGHSTSFIIDRRGRVQRYLGGTVSNKGTSTDRANCRVLMRCMARRGDPSCSAGKAFPVSDRLSALVATACSEALAHLGTESASASVPRTSAACCSCWCGSGRGLLWWAVAR